MACEDGLETDLCISGSGWKGAYRYSFIRRLPVHAAPGTEVYEAIHGILAQTIIRIIARDQSRRSGVRSRQAPSSRSAEAERNAVKRAGGAHRKRAARQEVDGRTADRQLQSAGRQAGHQAAAQHLPPNSHGVTTLKWSALTFTPVTITFLTTPAAGNNACSG